MSKDANDLLMQGGLPSPKLKEVGDRFDGVIVALNPPFQQRSMDTGKPLCWNDDPDAPIMVVPIEVRSDVDGESYGLYVRASSDLQSALAKAVRESGARGVEAGAHVQVAVVGKEPASKKGFSDKKLHAVIYTPRARQAASDTLMGNQASEASAQPQEQAAAQKPEAAKLPEGFDELPAHVQALIKQHLNKG